MPLHISLKVRAKLAQPDHNVTEEEIVQCFANRHRGYCTDSRPEHQTPIPTQWFVSETDYGRWLKVVFIHDQLTNIIEVKSAYPATAEVTRIYEKYSLIA
jgi:uncharacterized protein YqcC (DUF446 family)